MRTIIIDGRIGKDGAKVMRTNGGKEYIRFSLANDSFVNGKTKTDWFDVTCFDQHIVQNKAKYLTQGRYVIVNGGINSEVSYKNDGKIFLNHYISANSIEFPSLGTKKEDAAEGQVSTFTGNTESAKIAQQSPANSEPQVQVSTMAKTAGSVSAPSADDDLPF